MTTRNKVADRSYDVDAGEFTFTFHDEKEPVVLSLDDLDEGMIRHLALHGLRDKCGDAFADFQGFDDAREKVARIWGNLKAGVWATRSTGGKLATALYRVMQATKTPRTETECREALAKMGKKEKADLRKSPAIKKELAKMEMEAAQRYSDDDGLDVGELFQ